MFKQPISTVSDQRGGLSLCMIVRDSAATLRPCLSGIRPWVDEMVVIDTGSRDHTREIATEHGARVYDFPWCDDFSAARNESIRHARGQWIFWMDSDDTISDENGCKLRELAGGHHQAGTLGYMMQVHCPAADATDNVTVVDHVKLFRNIDGLRFEFRIHEQLLPSIRRLGGEIQWTDIFVTHSGSDFSPEGRRRKHERDLRLLTAELEDRPDHPFALFNLGMTFSDMDRYEEAATQLERCLAVSTPGESHLRKAYALLIGCYTHLGRDEQALNLCRGGLTHFPGDPEIHFRQGILAHKLGRLQEAETSYQAVFKPATKRFFMSRDRGITGYKARHNLALVYSDMGRPDLAELQWRMALNDEPSLRSAWQGLGQLMVQQGRYTSAEIEAEGLLTSGLLRPTGMLLLAEIRKRQNRLDDAQILLKHAAAEFPDDIDVLQALCQFLFEHGPLEDAVSAQQQLLEKTPSDAAAHHNMGSIHLQSGRLEFAAESYRRSLALRPDSVPTHLQLGHTLQALGLKEEALAAWREARRLSPTNPQVMRVLVAAGEIVESSADAQHFWQSTGGGFANESLVQTSKTCHVPDSVTSGTLACRPRHAT